MKQYWIAFVVFATITGGTFLGISCEPKAISQGTIEINPLYNGNCAVTVNIDGGSGSNAATFSANTTSSLYTFQNTIAPGDHTLYFNTGGSCAGPGCEISGPDSSLSNTSSYPLTFYVGAGEIYEAQVSQGGACNNIEVGAIN
jgi:hypothetical protein